MAVYYANWWGIIQGTSDLQPYKLDELTCDAQLARYKRQQKDSHCIYLCVENSRSEDKEVSIGAYR